MSIKDGMIAMVLMTVIKKINNNFDVSELIHTYNADGRTMTIVITDLNEGTGFSVADGVLKSGDIDNPTCAVRMTKDTLAAILTDKITHQQAFLMGSVDVISNERLRDSIVLNKIFNEMKEIVVRTG